MGDKLGYIVMEGTTFRDVEDNETLVGTETLPKKVKKSAPVRGGVPLVEAK